MTTVANLFDDGAEHFERFAPALWNTMGNAVVAAADLHIGQSVLDACVIAAGGLLRRTA